MSIGYINAVINPTDSNYLKDNLTDFLNLIVSSCINITGDTPLEKDIFKNITSIQFQALNKTLYIQTEKYNYVLSEADGTLRLCEFYKNLEDMNK